MHHARRDADHLAPTASIADLAEPQLPQLLVRRGHLGRVVANDSLPDAVNVLLFAVPGFIGGTGGVIGYVGLTALRQSITPQRVLGRVWASASVLGAVMSVVGALLGGLLGDTVGLRPAIALAAVAYAIPFVYSLVSPLRSAASIVAAAGKQIQATTETKTT